MTLRVVALVSIVLNICLSAVLFHRVKHETVAAEAPTPLSGSELPGAIEKTQLVRVVVTPRSPVTNQFHWNRLESSDFRQYIANLRAIGCPPETIRDLIAAEINKLFAPRFAALSAQTQLYAYWKPGPTHVNEDLRRQFELLQQEKRDLRLALLGSEGDPSEKWTTLSIDSLAEQSHFAFLPPDKEKRVRELLEKYKRLAPRQQFESGDSDETKRMREERRQELAQVLTPQELYEVDLRDSNTAESVRRQFGSRDLTEDQYRELFALRRAYEDEQGVIGDDSDPEKIERRNEARKQLDRAYQAALSAKR